MATPGDQLGIFNTIDEAVEAARRSQAEIRTLELRDKIIANQRRRLTEQARSLAEEAVAETGLGNIESKILKIASRRSGRRDRPRKHRKQDPQEPAGDRSHPGDRGPAT
jgi:acyl-CoA reductase-like NAD-dependent aldehyde dehydrogenase